MGPLLWECDSELDTIVKANLSEVILILGFLYEYESKESTLIVHHPLFPSMSHEHDSTKEEKDQLKQEAGFEGRGDARP